MMTPAGRAFLDKERKDSKDPRQLDLPWGGRSPRVLTEAYQRFNLRAGDGAVEPVDAADEELINEQYRRFLGCGFEEGNG